MEGVKLPCGKCPECLKRRASGWSYRLRKQGDVSTSALFVTLTFGNGMCPKSKKGYNTLVKKDDETQPYERKDGTIGFKTHPLSIPAFIKRLRTIQGEPNIKYYAVGEYGTENERPHYHLILFNSNYDAVLRVWSLDGKPIGQVHFGDVNGASIGYVLKYMTKPSKIPKHKNDDRMKEFSLMSKGLGANYITEKMKQWHKASPDRMYITIEDGKKISMPRYYKDKIYGDDPELKDHVAYLAKLRGDKKIENDIENQGDNYENYLRSKEEQAYRKMYKNSIKNRSL